jgi:hypothetical protein
MFYSNLLKTYPLTTKSITSGILFSIGDAVTQSGKYGYDVVIEKK